MYLSANNLNLVACHVSVYVVNYISSTQSEIRHIEQAIYAGRTWLKTWSHACLEDWIYICHGVPLPLPPCVFIYQPPRYFDLYLLVIIGHLPSITYKYSNFHSLTINYHIFNHLFILYFWKKIIIQSSLVKKVFNLTRNHMKNIHTKKEGERIVSYICFSILIILAI